MPLPNLACPFVQAGVSLRSLRYSVPTRFCIARFARCRKERKRGHCIFLRPLRFFANLAIPLFFYRIARFQQGTQKRPLYFLAALALFCELSDTIFFLSHSKERKRSHCIFLRPMHLFWNRHHCIGLSYIEDWQLASEMKEIKKIEPLN